MCIVLFFFPSWAVKSGVAGQLSTVYMKVNCRYIYSFITLRDPTGVANITALGDTRNYFFERSEDNNLNHESSKARIKMAAITIAVQV